MELLYIRSQLPEGDVSMDLVLLTKLIIDIVDWIDLSVEEEIVLEILDLGWSERPCEVQSQVSLLLYVLVFRVVLWLTEALHESFESCPLPVSSGDELITDFTGKPLGRACTLEISSRSIVINIIGALHPFTMSG